MAELKLGKLPDRTPVKLTLTISPDLAEALGDYASLYKAIYQRDEPVAELVSAMLRAFLDSDWAFLKARSSSRPS